MLQVHQRTKASMATSSFSINDEINENLTQLEEKIVQLTKVVSRLAVPLTQAQALTTPIVKLSLIFGDEDPLSYEDEHLRGIKKKSISSTI